MLLYLLYAIRSLQYRPEKYSQKLNWLPPTTTRLVYCSPDEESDSDRESTFEFDS